MNVVIIAPFLSPKSEQSRPDFIRNVLVENDGFNVITLTSDFSHLHKKKKTNLISEGVIKVRTIPYNKNTSMVRFLSHLCLSFGLFFKALSFRKSTDVYYITAPFALVSFLVKLCTRKKVIVDIVDFWPNSLPFKRTSFLRNVLTLWSKINYYSINKADSIISLSTRFLDEANVSHDSHILLGSRSDFVVPFPKKYNRISILYLGNIGTLYDFDTLLSACRQLRKRGVQVHIEIIGDGDKKEWLLSRLYDDDVSYKYHGVIYDVGILKKIVGKCHVGFNGYSNTTASFSYKAASYFKFGLPVLNSMSGDLYRFVDEYEIGFNYEERNVESLVTAILSMLTSEIPMHENVKLFFRDKLDYDIVSKKITNIFKGVFHEKNI